VALKAAVSAPAPKLAGLAPAEPTIMASDQSLDELARFLNLAEHVTLLCGSGCAGAHAELMQFADAVKSPIVHAMGGKDHVEWDNPYDVGMTGLLGFSSGYYIPRTLASPRSTFDRRRSDAALRSTSELSARSGRRCARSCRASRSRPTDAIWMRR
jgi:Thiamine pyrophosphate enzyme, central domain